MPKRKSKAAAVAIEPDEVRGLGGFIVAYPRECVAGLLGGAAVVTIFVNALYMQKGPHPAPIFATRPAAIAAAQKPTVVPQAPLAALPPSPAMQAPVAPPAAAPAASPPLNRVQTIAEIQRELTRRGYYEGVADGIWGAKTDAGARDFAQAAGVKVDPNAPEDLLRALTASKAAAAPVPQPARRDPIADLLAPSPRIVAIQRALADFGYGQIKPSGTVDAATRAAIEKFERDHRMPVTGQISDRFVRELSTMAGRPID
ncbi:MAG: peptidoglycan-binding protein [Proteobacteria bacterium]|nr:peptidoglycan-binding protein [Pseudomonadota bacterium]